MNCHVCFTPTEKASLDISEQQAGNTEGLDETGGCGQGRRKREKIEGLSVVDGAPLG